MPTPDTLSIPGPDNIVRVPLENGITVLAYENFSAQSVVVAGALPGGSIHEDPAQGGLAALTSGALMLGTEKRDFEAVHSALEDIGADLDFTSGMHNIGFSGKALAEDLPVLLDILADSLQCPTFPQAQVERLRGERLTWLQYRHQDTRWQAARAFRQNLYPDYHPYHHGVRGTLETLPRLTVDEVRAFHRRHYGPRGMIVVVVGAVQAQSAIDAVRRYVGAWENPQQSAAATLPDLSPVNEIRRQSVTVPGKSQTDIVIGALGPSRFAPDFQAANLANSILGQFGMMGRIGDIVREREGMAYYAYSRLDGGFGPGPWSISAGVNPANIERAIELCIEEIRRFTSEPVSHEDLADNQSYFTGRMPLQLESNEGIAGTLLTIENYRLGLDYLLKYHDTIYALAVDDLLAAAQRYLDPAALVITTAGPDIA
jgi:zinc protease